MAGLCWAVLHCRRREGGRWGETEEGGGGGIDNRQAANSITSSLQQQVPNVVQPGGWGGDWVRTVGHIRSTHVQQEASATVSSVHFHPNTITSHIWSSPANSQHCYFNAPSCATSRTRVKTRLLPIKTDKGYFNSSKAQTLPKSILAPILCVL